MKVVVLGLRGIPGVQGGVETHSEQLYPRIAARGHDVTVICRRAYVKQYPYRRYRGVTLLPTAAPRSSLLEAFVHTFLGLFTALTQRPDILHIHAIGPSLMVPLARLLGLRVVTTNHGADYNRARWNRVSRQILRLGEFLGSRFSNQVIAISEPIADHLRESFGQHASVIPNGVEIHVPSPETSALEQWGLTPQRYVLAVGRLVQEKGFHDLIEAFSRARMPGWKLVIVGRADHASQYSTELKQQAARVDSVVMTGFLTGEPLRQLYSHAGLFVLPSYHEGLPIALLEAMSYGLRVIASDIAANQQAGLPEAAFFPVGDIERAVQAMQAAVQAPFTDADRTRQRALVANRFDWERIADQTCDIYESIVRKRLYPNAEHTGMPLG